MDRIDKELAKLSLKDREKVRHILAAIVAGETSRLDIKKLRGRDDIYRARKGSVRVVYRLSKGVPFLFTIERRNEQTYRNL